MKICVVTPVYALAGVPLAQIRFARALVDKGHDVDLLIGRIYPGCRLPKIAGVHVLKLNLPNVRAMLLPLWKYLRTVKPDVVFSAEDHLNGVVLLAAITSGSKAKISGSSRVPPSDTYSNVIFSKGWVYKQLLRTVMWRADALTCVSKDMVVQYRSMFNSPPHICVYNIVDDQNSRLKMQESVKHEWFLPKSCPIVIAAGTLTRRKGFADLIHAMKELSQRRPVRLIILGDGYLRPKLETLILELCLSKVVSLHGFVENPLAFFARADVFVLSSYVEGLPNVLIEAMSCGCTPVSTDCPTGPSEVLQANKYGYLVPVGDSSAMAVGIEKALDSPIPINRLCEAIKPFSEDEVIKKHFDILGISDQNQ